MKTQILMSKGFMLIFASVLLTLSMQGISEGAPGGVCEVGDVLSPGESCMLPGGQSFWVSADGSGNLHTGGFTISAFGGAISFGGFGANSLGDGKWLIVQVGGKTTPPPVLTDPEVLVVDPDAPPIYWTDRGADKIQRINTNSSTIEDLVTRGQGVRERRGPSRIALDVADSKMYWTNQAAAKIQRANLDGSNIEDIIIRGLEEPYSIALDIIDGKMYWTDWGTDKIQRANLDGSNVENLITRGLDTPLAVALDVAGGKMYWTDNGTAKIQRANLNGSSIEDLVVLRKSPSGGPSGLALDVSGGKMYWTDYGTNKIQRANLNGSNVEDLVTTGLSNPGGIALDIAGGKMYWTDNGTAKIQRSNLDGSNIEDLITGLDKPAGIALGIPTQTAEDTRTVQVVREDVNGDGTVNIQDLVFVATNLDRQGENAADVNADGIVNIQDLVLVAGALGQDGAAAPSLYTDALVGISTADIKVWLSQARQRDMTDPNVRKGILFLEQLLASMVPKETALLSNYPNPFNPETWIPYQLSRSAKVTLHIYAANGRVVRTLSLGHQPAGVYQSRGRAAYWDGRNALGEPVASGVYFYTLTAGDFTATRKMLIRK